MSVRMRHTRSHTNNRRSHHALSDVATVVDKESGALRLSHRLDETTGMYRGTLIKTPRVKKERTKAEKYNQSKHTSEEQIVPKNDTLAGSKVVGTHDYHEKPSV